MAFSKPNVNTLWASTGSKVEPTLSKKQQGWVSEIPPFEFENWVQNRQDQFNAHVNQFGIPVWDSSTEYQANKSYAQGSDGIVYKAKQTHSNQNPVTDATATYWGVAFTVSGFSYSKAESDNLFLKKTNNLSDLSSSASARTNLSVYSKTESDGRYLRKSLNLSDVQDVTIARDNLNAYSKSDVYTKSESDARYLNEASNLSDIPDKGVARSNLDIYSRGQSDDKYIPDGSLQENGWTELSNGLIMQWGMVPANNSGYTYVDLPVTFPNALFSVSLADVGFPHASSFDPSDIGSPANRIGIRVDAPSSNVFYTAIGY